VKITQRLANHQCPRTCDPRQASKLTHSRLLPEPGSNYYSSVQPSAMMVTVMRVTISIRAAWRCMSSWKHSAMTVTMMRVTMSIRTAWRCISQEREDTQHSWKVVGRSFEAQHLALCHALVRHLGSSNSSRSSDSHSCSHSLSSRSRSRSRITSRSKICAIHRCNSKHHCRAGKHASCCSLMLQPTTQRHG